MVNSQQLQKALKKRGDTAVHIAVTDNDPQLLRDLLQRGLRVFNQSDADGATALHRAAENCGIECAKIILEYNADIDALNFIGQTAFHVVTIISLCFICIKAAEKQDFIFGKFLIKNRARKNCRSGCVKCRLFVKQIEKYDKNQKDQEKNAAQMKLEEQKVVDQEKQDQLLVEQMSQLNLMEEIQKCREETGGPFFSKKENKLLKEQHEQLRQQEDIRNQHLAMRGGRGFQNQVQRQGEQGCNSKNMQQPPNQAEIEYIKPQIRSKQLQQNNALNNFSCKELIQAKFPSQINSYQSVSHSNMIRPSYLEPHISIRELRLQQAIENSLQDQQNQFLESNDFKNEPPPNNNEERNKKKKNKRRKKKQDQEEEKKAAKSTDKLDYSDSEINECQYL